MDVHAHVAATAGTAALVRALMVGVGVRVTAEVQERLHERDCAQKHKRVQRKAKP